METHDAYEGFSNRETWLFCLWLDNEKTFYDEWRALALDTVEYCISQWRHEARDREALLADAGTVLADEIFCWLTDNWPVHEGLFSDLLEAAASRLDRLEAARHLLDGDEVNARIESWLDYSTEV